MPQSVEMNDRPEIVPAAHPPKAGEKSYIQILKSTALVGGSSVVSIAMGIVRTKVMAMLLGPAGVGLTGLYVSIANLTQSVAGMGVSSSGVRQIAEAAGSGDTNRIAQTAAVLSRTAIVLASVGAAVLIVFSSQISNLTFGTARNAPAVTLLSLAVFFNLISGAQGALIQGLRHISDLAQLNVWGALYGTVVTIPIVYFMRLKGVVPSLIAVAALSLMTSYWYSRRVRLPKHSLTVAAGVHEASALLKLGFAFMASSLIAMGSAYVVRIAVLHKLGIEATGFYHSAWTLGGLYVSFVLQAMAADFYPRLTASANNNVECNRLVNEQTRITLLLGGPGVIATLTFAPSVIALFYTVRFGPAIGILRWICLGAALRAVTWPMGFIIVAKGKQSLFLLCELAWGVVSATLAWLCIGYAGLNGAGIAFFGSYIFHFFLLYPTVRRLSGFRWSKENTRTALLLVFLVAITFCGHYLVPLFASVCIGVAAFALSGLYSGHTLLALIGPGRLSYWVPRGGRVA